tara:strand:+ start:37687 stop:38766 length:1080 start_codon:yes stop_codon:yes gene_type:complete
MKYLNAKIEVKLLLEKNPLSKKESDKLPYLTLGQVIAIAKSEPITKFLWNGIKEKSFGLIFGPSKSGKSIFCENLAMNLAAGKKEFLGYPLPGKPDKVLFIGMEEHWRERVNRNTNQLKGFNSSESKLIRENYLLQPLEFNKTIKRDEDWNNLKVTILKSKAKVVVIDSITRLNHGKLENSADAEKIMQNLRAICHDCGITLICIHHTPKIHDAELTMDSIKGSSVFAQESDFAIGIRATAKKVRYMKNVFFRYSSDNDEMVREFNIDKNCSIKYAGEVEEQKILKSMDRRVNNTNRDLIFDYFKKNPSILSNTNDLVNLFKDKLKIKKRQIMSYLSELINDGSILNPSRGQYILKSNV